ncbi:hypothetical protein [Halioxenophilus aromaticivorans]|uniref:Uncharacterized protein n=1 Tax=Halioxenophilus aromaticivorans TaxID=1306992 RepID=A0AAV3U1L9_9ALTE
MENGWYAFLVIVLVMFSILPLIIFILESIKNPIKNKGLLAWGIGLLVFAGVYFAFLTDGEERFKAVKVNSESEESLRQKIVSLFGLWIYIVPATYLSLGCSLMASYSTREEENA